MYNHKTFKFTGSIDRLNDTTLNSAFPFARSAP